MRTWKNDTRTEVDKCNSGGRSLKVHDIETMLGYIHSWDRRERGTREFTEARTCSSDHQGWK